MKLSKSTVDVLKNFTNYSPSLVFQPGNVIATYSGTVLARAVVGETFDRTFGIYDLRKFLGTIDLLDNPELDVTDTSISMTDGVRNINYKISDVSLIRGGKANSDPYNPKKGLDGLLPSTDIQLKINYSDFRSIHKAASVLKLPNIVITGDGTTGKVTIGTSDAEEVSGDSFSIDCGTTENLDFNLVFRKDNLQLVESEEYIIDISAKTWVCRFRGGNVDYYVAVETNSSIQGKVKV